MKNLKGAKELLEKYKSITLEELEQKYKRFPYYNGKFIMQTFTDFGTTFCAICKSENNICSNCIYSFRNEIPTFQCMDIIYKEMGNAMNAQDLFAAIQKRISYLTHVIEWYEMKEETK